MKLAGHVACMGEKCIQHLVRIPEERRPLGRPRRRWEDNIKMDLQRGGMRGIDWIDLALHRDRWRTLVNAVLNLRLP